jgi:hypothetical protein
MRPIAIAVLALAVAGSSAPAHAQFMRGPALPLTTTLTIEKPSPDANLRHRNTIDIGVKDKSYRFIVLDAYVDDTTGKFMWQDIWRSVEQFRPNFLVQGIGSDEFEKMTPGEVVTINGLYWMATRTFEVSHISPGPGNFAPKFKY